jgi:hypothetical protein
MFSANNTKTGAFTADINSTVGGNTGKNHNHEIVMNFPYSFDITPVNHAYEE